MTFTHDENNDLIIRKLLKQFKSLEIGLNKFNSKKYNNPSSINLKGNILRLTLLPFLRSHNPLSNLFENDSAIYKSLSSVVTSILIKWWLSLINNLLESQTNCLKNTPSQNISSVLTSDRNAYLEGISRILSLEYWMKTDSDTYDSYQKLLTFTMEYCLNKMSTLKNLSLSISAFFGKVMAYSFFNLPDVNHALLFLLGVKQGTLERTNKILNIVKSDISNSPYPSYLNWLINYQGINCLKKEKSFRNCMPPPKHPVSGIQDPNGNWVRRWRSCDSNVFNSFFRHYINIIGNNFEESLTLSNCPGFSIILSHIFQIFQISISRISNNPAKQTQNPPSNKIGNRVTVPIITLDNNSEIYHNSVIKILRTVRFIHFDGQENLDLLREQANSKIAIISNQLVTFIDKALVDIAKETTVYDTNRLGLILNITHEFINHIVNNIPNSSDLINWEFWLSCCYMLINNTDHIQIFLKNVAFLFNTWDMIPDALPKSDLSSSCYAWITNRNDSFKVNFSNWLINKENFSRFMTHWNPAIRSYYLRLLIWRIIGINNYQSSSSIQITKRLQIYLNISFKILEDFTLKFQDLCDLDFKPDTPLVNRKLGILPLNLKEDFISVADDPSSTLLSATPIKPSEIRKTHPFEILDEAIYSCSSLPSRSENSSNDSIDKESKDTQKNSIPFVNSLGRLFKILTTDDNSPAPNRKINNNSTTKLNKAGDRPFKRNSVSFSSLSTAYSSIKSRSSSPSIMSFSSTPTSTTETSSSFSNKDDDLGSIKTLDLVNQQTKFSNQPLEFTYLPPEIVRPIYKFDIIIDHESLNEKYNMINYKNSCINKGTRLNELHHQFLHSQHSKSIEKTNNFPKCPRIPLITIFVNSVYNTKFYFNDEENLIIENIDIDESLNNETGLFDEFSKFISEDPPKVNNVNLMKLINLGRSLTELNVIIEEFKNFLNTRVGIDQFNLQLGSSSKYFDELNYFHQIIPFLSIDSSNESKLLNAS